MKQIHKLMGGVAVCTALVLVGCNPPAGTGPKGGTGGTGPVKTGKDDHSHGAGPNGGALGDWGRGKLHVEFTVDHDKQEATVYILGSDAKTPAPIKAKDGQISASVTGVNKDKSTFEVTLKADPQKSDPEGKSSRFVGKHEKIGVVQEFEGTITGEDAGTPYTGKFKEEPAKK